MSTLFFLVALLLLFTTAKPAEFGRAREAAMNSFFEFMAVVSAILGAMGLAMGLEWLALNGLMRMMPAKPRTAAPAPSHGPSPAPAVHTTRRAA